MLATDDKLPCYSLKRKEGLQVSCQEYTHPLNVFPGMKSFLIKLADQSARLPVEKVTVHHIN